MKRKLLLLILFQFYYITLSAQKSYEFDYVLEYESSQVSVNGLATDKKALNYQFFNSKDNSYMLSVISDSAKTRMWLVLSNGETFYGDISTEDFFVQGISLKCPKSWKKNNNQYEKLKDYALKIENDTMLNSQNYQHYVVTPLKGDKKETHYPNPVHNIIDNTLNLNIPILNPTGLLFRKWKAGDNVPNGVIKESYMITEKGKVSITKLVQCVKTQKIIFIDKNCK